MARRTWKEVKASRMGDSAVEAAYAAAKRAFELGEQARELREQRGWSQQELASRTGLSQPAIARFEAGGTTPTLVTLERLAHALDMDLHVALKPKSAA